MLCKACFSPSLFGFHPIWMCVWGKGGWLPRGVGHNLLMRFSSLGSSRMEISETNFFDTVTIQNDQISYLKHVLTPLDVFFTLFGCGGGGGGSQGGRGTTCLCSFLASAAQEWSSLSPLRGALLKAIEFEYAAPHGTHPEPPLPPTQFLINEACPRLRPLAMALSCK